MAAIMELPKGQHLITPMRMSVHAMSLARNRRGIEPEIRSGFSSRPLFSQRFHSSRARVATPNMYHVWDATIPSETMMRDIREDRAAIRNPASCGNIPGFLFFQRTRIAASQARSATDNNPAARSRIQPPLLSLPLPRSLSLFLSFAPPSAGTWTRDERGDGRDRP